jgi:hypothetical protein
VLGPGEGVRGRLLPFLGFPLFAVGSPEVLVCLPQLLLGSGDLLPDLIAAVA